jgi:O-antigen biosynthesis protein
MIPARIAVVLFSTGISGGNNIIFNYCGQADPERAQITLVYVRADDLHDIPPWHPLFDRPGIRWRHIDEVAAEQFDIAVFTYFETVYVADRLNAKRCVYFVQSIESRFFDSANRLSSMRAEATYTLGLGTVTVARWIADYLRDVHGAAPAVVPNGIDKELFAPTGTAVAPRSERLRVLVEGSSAPFKKVHETLQLLHGVPDVELWLLSSSHGVGEELADRAFCSVPIDSVPEIMRSCHALVKLSTVEGMFGPPLEMFHCGGTAVTSDVTGHDEYLRHGVNGFVVPIAELARARGYVELLSVAVALREKLQSEALRTAAQWPSMQETGARFWDAVTEAAAASDVGTREAALRLKPARFLLRAQLRDARAQA